MLTSGSVGLRFIGFKFHSKFQCTVEGTGLHVQVVMDTLRLSDEERTCSVYLSVVVSCVLFFSQQR